LWSAVANITFTQAQDQASADFLLVQSNTTGTNQSFPTLHLRPSIIGEPVVSPPSMPGDSALPRVTIGTDTAPLNGLFETSGFQGGDSYYAIVHELGHLIGLGHSGPVNSSQEGNPPVDPALQVQISVYDTMLWSMMSYVRPENSGAAFFDQYPVMGTNWGTTPAPDGLNRLPTTPMMLDILAAQRLYGLPTSGPLVDGHDTFGFNVNLGDPLIERYFDFTDNTHPVITIWDGGLDNTLDLSGWNTPADIDLEPGSFSSANGMINNIGIAGDTFIDTGIGGGGNDEIIGNSHANLLIGNSGNDTMSGLLGNDTLDGGIGADDMSGGPGDDLYRVDNPGDVVTEAAGEGYDIVVAVIDKAMPANTEALYMVGSGLTGTGTANADSLLSAGGANTMIGLEGDDLYYVNNIGDTVTEAPGAGYDTVVATVDYALPANTEAMYMVGSGLTGTGSNNADSLFSGGGANTLVGLAGDDLYYVNNTADVVIEQPNGGFDTVQSSVSYTLPDNVEVMWLIGSGLTGTGTDNPDILASIGANTLFGRGANDMFVFTAGSANGATVGDFGDLGDILVFSGFGTAAQGATFSETPTAGQWQIHSGLDAHNESLTLANNAALQPNDFVFV